jgi:hypothetical protein
MEDEMKEVKSNMSIEVDGEYMDVSIYIPETADDDNGDACELHIFLKENSIIRLCAGDAMTSIVEQMALLKSKLVRRVHAIGLQYDVVFGDNECFGVVDGKLYLMFFGHLNK